MPAQPERPLLRQLLDAQLESGPFWDSQLVRRNRADLSQEARDAERLSVAHNGAMRLYNLLCARQAGDVAAVEDWLAECETWSAEHPPDEWQEWNLTAFWDRVSTAPGGAGGKGELLSHSSDPGSRCWQAARSFTARARLDSSASASADQARS